MTISWDVDKSEMDVIGFIADRAFPLYKNAKYEVEYHTVVMDIIACHANGCPLKLQELLDADNGTFAHDIMGIARHIDRKTGHLKDCFLPRLAQPEAA